MEIVIFRATKIRILKIAILFCRVVVVNHKLKFGHRKTSFKMWFICPILY
jgi:hypothetical protein